MQYFLIVQNWNLYHISKWVTNNVNNMSCLFKNCLLLKSLPDISRWNTINVTDMNQLFYNCSKLESLPDISKWNTSNVAIFLAFLIIAQN